ncbi:MAG: 16S rRNA (guanine(527)-N(7))-methyltransferase RsmG [Defluviitaleaceae bacterium]|nr:16S rRNA (guanine(527)-N(7))-methyltransferase RsmG [Defluviitaleaceae bacterium]
MLENLLKTSANALNIEVSNEQIQKFIIYKNLILEWNKKFNLTAITCEKEIVLKHFVDSISLMKIMDLSGAKKVIDVGSGAGFPGIPLKIMNDNIELTMLDSVNKKVGFMNMVCKELGLLNSLAIHARAEDLAKDKNYREQYDLCVSRAVANLSVLAEFCLPFVKISGCFAAFKGPSSDMELEAAQNALSILGGEVYKNELVNLGEDLNHRIILIEKTKNTQEKYPRRAGIVRDKPL